ncbi:oxygenase MpaB family protein [Conexibacter sp. SYSU D00693]|uniref:oxygenase MpaB family protein n=1 Tax=Conexibacter sp. SYSU D00693 TaxID=2812560 RepID=UPI00196A6AFC|nr:oxygenase MpaB family protein [Conexibacter sp. SYSU D00693]
MAAGVLPAQEEVPTLAISPDSVVWRRSSDARLALTSGLPLVLQTAHPAISAAIDEHSRFRTDPWSRLEVTLDYTHLLIYGGPAAAAVTGRVLRRMHQPIRGVRPDGERYTALEPRVWAWVHASTLEAMVQGHEHFGDPWLPGELDELWAQWRAVGRLIGVRDRVLPPTYDGYRAYVDEQSERLEASPVLDDLIHLMARPPAPPGFPLGGAGWLAVGRVYGDAARLALGGLMDPALRARLGISWSPLDAARWSALRTAVRAAGRALPESTRVTGPSYLRRRRKAMARGPFAQAAAHLPG